MNIKESIDLVYYYMYILIQYYYSIYFAIYDILIPKLISNSILIRIQFLNIHIQ